MRIAVDAMGGDHAPGAIVAGACAALARHREQLTLTLVGDEQRLRQELRRQHQPEGQPGLDILHASQSVGMHERASEAWRSKKDSSIRRAAELVAGGRADGLVSAGNTGAVVATARFVIGRLPGVERPAVAAELPTLGGHCLLLDVGASVDCKPRHLVQFAVMGHYYVQEIHGVERPRLGLLSIGEEASKGNLITREVYRELDASQLNFIGNVEGRDIYRGRADVIVCDGFVGNLVLKTSESVVEMIKASVRGELERSWRLRLAAWLGRSRVRELLRGWDHTEVGGAPLLGLDGACIICHGRSDAKSFANALSVAREFVAGKVNRRIQDKLEEMA